MVTMRAKLLLLMSLDSAGIGRRIAEMRETNGWTQLELAYKANVSPSTVYRWESGKLPAVRELIRIAEVLGVEATYLLEGEGGRVEDPTEATLADVWLEVRQLRSMVERLYQDPRDTEEPPEGQQSSGS